MVAPHGWSIRLIQLIHPNRLSGPIDTGSIQPIHPINPSNQYGCSTSIIVGSPFLHVLTPWMHSVSSPDSAPHPLRLIWWSLLLIDPSLMMLPMNVSRRLCVDSPLVLPIESTFLLGLRHPIDPFNWFIIDIIQSISLIDSIWSHSWSLSMITPLMDAGRILDSDPFNWFYPIDSSHLISNPSSWSIRNRSVWLISFNQFIQSILSDWSIYLFI